TARVEAELASKAKSEFIASMSHELRTPLNAIIGFSDMMQSHKDLPDAQTDQYATYINEAAQHLLQLINEILDVSKIQAGALTVDLQMLDVKPMVESCVHFVEMRAAEQGVKVICNIADDLPAIKADPLRLKQVMLNLLSNAVKFTDEGGKVTVDVAAEQKGYVEFCVTDTGRGMSQEELLMATQPFGQVRGGHSNANEGTGLGVPISAALIKSHGGKFTLESKQNAGTCARFIIPTGTNDEVSIEAEIASAQHDTAQAETSSPAQPAH
ncbi:MAG: HAMP domain-containing sensor histidine kinase, partial [Pseudomonadota bacterium]